MLCYTIALLLCFACLFTGISSISIPRHLLTSAGRNTVNSEVNDVLHLLKRIRGGAKPKKKSKKEIIEEETFEKEEEKSKNKDVEDVEDIDDADFDDKPFTGQQNQMVTSITDIWTKTPPITQVNILLLLRYCNS